MTSIDPPFPCPCCGYLVHDDPAGSDDMCPICFWEDDLSQLRFFLEGGANRLSLVDSQHNYASIGAVEGRLVQYVRSAGPADRRDAGWRMVDLARDHIEIPDGDDYGNRYQTDFTVYYYWRRSAARRLR